MPRLKKICLRFAEKKHRSSTYLIALSLPESNQYTRLILYKKKLTNNQVTKLQLLKFQTSQNILELTLQPLKCFRCVASSQSRIRSAALLDVDKCGRFHWLMLGIPTCASGREELTSTDVIMPQQPLAREDVLGIGEVSSSSFIRFSLGIVLCIIV